MQCYTRVTLDQIQNAIRVLQSDGERRWTSHAKQNGNVGSIVSVRLRKKSELKGKLNRVECPCHFSRVFECYAGNTTINSLRIWWISMFNHARIIVIVYT